MKFYIKETSAKRTFPGANDSKVEIILERLFEGEGRNFVATTREMVLCLTGKTQKDGREYEHSIQVRFTEVGVFNKARKSMMDAQMQQFGPELHEIFLKLTENFIIGQRYLGKEEGWKCFVHTQEKDIAVEVVLPITDFDEIIRHANQILA